MVGDRESRSGICVRDRLFSLSENGSIRDYYASNRGAGDRVEQKSRGLVKTELHKEYDILL